MKLLVLGGTVFLSKTVVSQALERGHDVTAAARGTNSEPPKGARFVKIDRDTGAGMAALAAESFDAVVDVARVPGQVGRALDLLGDRAGHWTFVSTVSVYAENGIPGQTAQTAALLEPTAADSDDQDVALYGQSKVASENLVTERVGDKAFIARAGLIIGNGDPGYRFGYWPDRIGEGGEVLAPGAPEELVQYIDVRDLASWILDAAEKGLTGTFDAISPPQPRGQFLAEIAEGVGADPSFTWVPQDFLEEHQVKPWSGEQSLGLWLPLPEYAGFMTRDTSAAVEAGMSIRPVAQTAADWYATKGERPAPTTGLTRDKEREVLDAWRQHLS